MAYEWTQPKTATVKFNVGMDENGNIATGGAAAAGKKAFSLPGIATNANFSDTNKVFGAYFTGLAGATYDQTSGIKTVTYTVKEVD